MSSPDLTSIVIDYYTRVDAGDVEWVIDLFAPQCVYQRADAIYTGKEEVANFYRNNRKIVGKHSLENVISNEQVVLVNGIFQGVGLNRAPKDIGFADAWRFGQSNRVTHRKTYLAIGSDYVKD